ncbi:hypothetical protein Q9Q94_13720 [Uliginosibacterium sp. 31-16]|uniref:hypothetical protein n=1 Tax=Uliginosibacterium sp. 31-16 TaxID=3068315 RepID=UPI00273FE7C5|nr:hypothetical protein [Uliginosibacterium sp. 31-16]MDP5240598.1 hypothetical protein [Uliginosibacterium sp. 31-16]
MGFISDFLNRKKIDELAERLGKQFTQRLPFHRAGDEKRFSGEFEIALGHIQGFQRKEKLGTFGKARLINGFQWALIENGYEKTLAHKISHSIATRLTASPAAEKTDSQ